jgi:hypothetical protein
MPPPTTSTGTGADVSSSSQTNSTASKPKESIAVQASTPLILKVNDPNKIQPQYIPGQQAPLQRGHSYQHKPILDKNDPNYEPVDRTFTDETIEEVKYNPWTSNPLTQHFDKK